MLQYKLYTCMYRYIQESHVGWTCCYTCRTTNQPFFPHLKLGEKETSLQEKDKLMVYSVTRFSVMHEVFGHIHNYITKIILNMLQNHRDIHNYLSSSYFQPNIYFYNKGRKKITRTEKFNGIFFHDC